MGLSGLKQAVGACDALAELRYADQEPAGFSIPACFGRSSLAPSGPYTLPREYRALYVCGRTDSPRFRVSKGTDGTSSPPAYLPSPVWIREQRAKERMTQKEVPEPFLRWKTFTLLVHTLTFTPSHSHLGLTTN